MNKNTKIALGCLWVSGVCAGTMLGGFINEKINQKYVVPNIKRWRDLAETFKDELHKSYDEISELKKELNKDEA